MAPSPSSKSTRIAWQEAEDAVEADDGAADTPSAPGDAPDHEDASSLSMSASGDASSAVPADHREDEREGRPPPAPLAPAERVVDGPSGPGAPSGRLVWSAEDAGHFLTQSIRTAQEPLERALNRQAARRWWGLVFVLAVLIPTTYTVIGGWNARDAAVRREQHLLRELEDARRRADAAVQNALDAHGRAERAQALLTENRTQTEDAHRMAETRRQEAETVIQALRAGIKTAEVDAATARANAEALQHERDGLQKTVDEAGRWQRERDLIRAQLAGMRKEQEALREQLAAARALLDDPAPREKEAATREKEMESRDSSEAAPPAAGSESSNSTETETSGTPASAGGGASLESTEADTRKAAEASDGSDAPEKIAPVATTEE